MNTSVVLERLYVLSDELEVIEFLFERVETAFAGNQLASINELLSRI